MYKLEESLRIKNIEKRFRKPIRDVLYNLHWNKNLKHSEIGEKLGIPRSTITKWFHLFDVPTQSCRRFTDLNLEKHWEWLRKNKKPKIKKEFPWHFNKAFFEQWSDEMAYVLGFLTADGAVFTNPRGSNYFAFYSTDREIIEKIRNILNSNHKIGVRKAKDENRKTSYALQIGSKKIVNHLKKFGIVQNKSLTINLSSDNIPRRFFKDFLRGYFDGDGGVHFGFYYRRDRNKYKHTFSTHFTSGSRQFLIDLLDYIRKSTKVVGGSLYKKPNNKGFALSFSVRDSFKLYQFMYTGVKKDYFLERKYNAFLKAINYYAGVAQ